MIGPAVLGIDPSQTAAGIAIIAGGHRHMNWPCLLRSVGESGHRTDPWTQRARRIVAQVKRITYVIADAATNHGAQYHLAVIEGPAYANKLPSQFDRAGVFWGVLSAIDTMGIPIAIIPPTTRAMFATGHGHADKRLVVSETRNLWSFPNHPVAIRDDNQADALTLATMGAMNLGWPLPFKGGPMRRHIEIIAKCDWPEVISA